MGWDDKLDNAKDDAVGGAKERIGEATDDAEMERKGRKQRAKGNIKQAGEKIKDAVRDT
ncbi:MAG: CsbD family protein [Actinomycetota bacterium]